MYKFYGLLLATSMLAVGAKAQEHYSVYILTGQSNSLGTTSLEGGTVAEYGPGNHPGDGATAFFWSNVDSDSTDEQVIYYGDSGGTIETIQMQQGGGVNPAFWGPEVGFARQMYDSGRTNVFVIKASRGGGNTFWVPEGDTHHMWLHLKDTVDDALAELTQAGNTFTVKGFMYLQGESNSGSEAALAGSRLNDLRLALKSHINTSYPEAADNMHSVIGEIAASSYNNSRIVTTHEQQALADSLDSVTFISTNDLPLKSDNIHFGRDSKLEIGERFADAFIAAEQIPEPATVTFLVLGATVLFRKTLRNM